jgi:hypothetical protein
MISDAQQALESGKLKLKGQYASMEDYLAKVDKKDVRQVADATKENVITEVNRVDGVTVMEGKIIDATSGYQVGIDKITEQSFETMNDLMDAVVARGYKNYGAWKSSKTGRWILDPSSRYVNDLDDALNIGATSKQVTIWDWNKKEEWSVSTRKVIKMPKTPGPMGGSGAAPASTPPTTPAAPATPAATPVLASYTPPSQGKTIKVGDRVISEVNIKRNLETFADDPSVDAIQETKNALRGIGERFKTFQSQNQGPLSKMNPSPYTVPSVEELDAFVDEVVAGMKTSDALPTAPTPTLEGLPTATPTPVVQSLSATPAVPTAKVPGRVRKYNTDTFKAADDYVTTSRTKVRDTIEGANFKELPETPKSDSMSYQRYEELRDRFEEVFGSDDEMNDLLDSLEGYLPEKKHQEIMDMLDEYGSAGDDLIDNRNRMEEIFDQLSDPNLDDATKKALSDELDELSDTVQTQLNDGFYQGDLPTSDDFTLDEEFKVATPEEREAAKRGIDILDNDGNVYKNVNKIDEETIQDIAVYKDDIVTSDTGAVSYKKKYTIPLTSGEGELYIQAPQIRNKKAYVVYQDNYQVMLNDSPLFTKIDKYSDEPVTFMTKTQAAKKVREAYKADLAKLEGRPYNAKALQTEDDWFTEAIEQEQAAEKVIEARKATELPKKEAPTLEGIPSKVEPEVVKTSAPAYNKVEETTQMANKSTKTKKVAIGTGTNNTFDVSISSKSDKAILEDVIDQAQTKGLKLEDYSIYKQGTPEYNSILPEESILDDGTGATVRLTAENRDKKLLEAINYKLVDTKYGKFAIDGDSTVGGLRDVKDVVQPKKELSKSLIENTKDNRLADVDILKNIKDDEVITKVNEDFKIRKAFIKYQTDDFESWINRLKEWKNNPKGLSQKEFFDILDSNSASDGLKVKEEYQKLFPNLPEEEAKNIGYALTYGTDKTEFRRSILHSRYNIISGLNNEMDNAARTGVPYYQEEFLGALDELIKDYRDIMPSSFINIRDPYRRNNYTPFIVAKESSEAVNLKQEVLDLVKKYSSDRSYLYQEITKTNLDNPLAKKTAEEIKDFYKFMEQGQAFAKANLPIGKTINTEPLTGELGKKYFAIKNPETKKIADKYYTDFRLSQKINTLSPKDLLGKKGANILGSKITPDAVDLKIKPYTNFKLREELKSKSSQLDNQFLIDFIDDINEKISFENSEGIFQTAYLKKDIYDKLFKENLKEIPFRTFIAEKNLELASEANEAFIEFVKKSKEGGFTKTISQFNKTEKDMYDEIFRIVDDVFDNNPWVSTREFVREFKTFKDRPYPFLDIKELRNLHSAMKRVEFANSLRGSDALTKLLKKRG